MTLERQLQDRVRLIFGADPACVFHENVVGSGVLRRRNEHQDDDTAGSQRFRKYGYANPGGADLIGIFRGRFVAVELKTKTGRQRRDQTLYQKLVESKGGLYFIVRSEDDAHAVLVDLHRRFPC